MFAVIFFGRNSDGPQKVMLVLGYNIKNIL